MFKMIIVDDEDITRQGICESVNWELMDIEIVGEATNGLEAMLLIHDKSPDIVVCDIRMPKLDGISLINEVKPSHPDLQVLFISGYSDREYLKNAIKLAAVDYLFKPFQLHELVAAIEKAKNNCINKRNTTTPSDSDVAFELLNYANVKEDIHRFDNLPIKLNTQMVSIIIKLNTKLLQKIENRYENAFDSQIVVSHYYNVFRETANRIFGGRYVISCGGTGYVIHANIGESSSERQAVFSRLNDFFFVIDGAKDAITIGVSEPYKEISNLHSGYVQAKEATVASFLIGYGRLIFYRNISSEQFVPFAQLQARFYDNIKSNNFGGAIAYLQDYIEYMSSCRPCDIPVMKDIIASIAFWLSDELKGFSNEAKGYITDIINSAENIHVIESYLLKQLDIYVEEIASLDSKGHILLEAERYILQNYDKELSIKTIAQKVFITPNYLCYLYKKKTGRTINRFILEIKMDKARKMVCESNARLGEIAESLGYANQNYFTRTFTKYFGASPRAYRNKNGKPGLIELESEAEKE